MLALVQTNDDVPALSRPRLALDRHADRAVEGTLLLDLGGVVADASPGNLDIGLGVVAAVDA